MGNSHQNFAEPEEMDIGVPAKQVVCCKGCNFLLVVPSILRVSLEEIMKYEIGEVPYIIEFLIEMLKKEGSIQINGLCYAQLCLQAIDQRKEFFALLEPLA